MGLEFLQCLYKKLLAVSLYDDLLRFGKGYRYSSESRDCINRFFSFCGKYVWNDYSYNRKIQTNELRLETYLMINKEMFWLLSRTHKDKKERFHKKYNVSTIDVYDKQVSLLDNKILYIRADSIF